MLFATYQSIDEMKEQDRPEYSVWALPVRSIKEFFISSAYCVPNRLELLVFFECDEYLRIDKVRWYQAINGATRDQVDPRAFVSDTADDLHSVFLVKAIDEEQIKLILPIFDIGEELNILEQKDTEKNNQVAEYLLDKANDVIDNVDPPIDVLMSLGMNRDYAEYRAVMMGKKLAFELIYLPFVVTSVLADTPKMTVNVWYFANMISKSLHKICYLSDRFTRWSLSDCDADEYDELVEQMGHCVIESEEIVERLVFGPEIARNEPCPCGSGKKWKKCHGKWLD